MEEEKEELLIAAEENKERSDKLSRDLSDASAELSDVKSKIEMMELESKELQEQLQQSENAVSESEYSKKELQTEVARLQRLVDVSVHTVDIPVILRIFQENSKEISRLSNNHLEQDLEDIKKQHIVAMETVENKLHDACQERELLADTNNNLMEEAQHNKKQMSYKEEESARLRSEIDDKDEENSKLCEQIDEKDAKLNEVRNFVEFSWNFRIV